MSLSTLQNFISFMHEPAINNVTNLCNFVGKMVCVCVSLSVYLELLTHFLPFKIHLTNKLPILIRMVDFKNLHEQLVLPLRQVENSSTGQVGKQVIVIPWVILKGIFEHLCLTFVYVIVCFTFVK